MVGWNALSKQTCSYLLGVLGWPGKPWLRETLTEAQNKDHSPKFRPTSMSTMQRYHAVASGCRIWIGIYGAAIAVRPSGDKRGDEGDIGLGREGSEATDK